MWIALVFDCMYEMQKVQAQAEMNQFNLAVVTHAYSNADARGRERIEGGFLKALFDVISPPEERERLLFNSDEEKEAYLEYQHAHLAEILAKR